MSEKYKKQWQKSLQRHHDYYVALYRKGELKEIDMANYHLALAREKRGEVKP